MNGERQATTLLHSGRLRPDNGYYQAYVNRLYCQKSGIFRAQYAMSPRLPADQLDAPPPEHPISLHNGQSRGILRLVASALPARNSRLSKHGHSPQKKSLKTRSKRIPEQGGFLSDFLSAGKRQIHGTT